MTGLLEFMAARLGQHVQSHGGKGGQCVDLVELWWAAQGKPPVGGNAVDLIANAPSAAYVAVPNGPVNYPAAGDVVCWHGAPTVGIGIFGHTGICLVADASWLVTLDQNWPERAPVAVVLHSYAGVQGWLKAR